MTTAFLYLAIGVAIAALLIASQRVREYRKIARSANDAAREMREDRDKWKSYCDDNHTIWGHGTSPFLLDTWPDDLIILISAKDMRQVRYSPPYLPPAPERIVLTDREFDHDVNMLVAEINKIADRIRRGSPEDPEVTKRKFNRTIEDFRSRVSQR